MPPTACVDVPALPLQLLRRRRPEWASFPVVVVEQNRPQGVILWVDARSRRAGVLPGMRYTEGLSLEGSLRAAEVSDSEIRQGMDLLTGALRRFSPDVEPSRREPGVFWVAAGGMNRLFPSPRAWAREIRTSLGDLGFRTRVAVGFTKFGTYASARAGRNRGLAVFRGLSEEAASAHRVPLGLLDLPTAALDALGKLGIGTVGELLRLPASGLRERFGPETHRLHALASGTEQSPLEPAPIEEAVCRETELDHPETDLYRLLFLVKRLLDPLLERLAARREAVAGLELRIRLDGLPKESERLESLRPAEPTLDSRQLLNLVHLRLEAVGISEGVVGLRVEAQTAPANRRQLALFAARPRRDPEAAERALARIRAELGDGAVVTARLVEAHLPEARFSWSPLERLSPPEYREVGVRPLVRRIRTRPAPLLSPARHQPDGWLLRGEECGPVDERTGPYVISGGWWRRPVHREYHFARMRRGEIFWIYYDRPRRQWFLQGQVE